MKRIRLPDDAEAAIATPAGLRAALRDIFNEYQEPKDPVGGRLVRGAAFARGATFSICSAVGNYFLNGTPMDVDLNDLVGQAARKGLLAGEQVSGVWTTYLEKSDEFYEAILLIREVPQEVSPGTNIDESLKARGFAVRFSHKSPLTADEKERIKAALSDLADQGPAIMGRYRYVANWIATVRLGSQRSRGQVASHMRLLIKEAHAAAVLRGKTTHPLPQELVFTQPATEADDAVDPERLEVEAESDDDSDDDVFDDFSD